MNAKLYFVILFSRIFLSIYQNGYIHPDEYFQTVEISAGDILEIDILRTWEFTSNRPIRSIIPIFIFWSPPFCIIKLLSSISSNLINSSNLLTVTRFYTCLLSLIIDYNILKLSDIFYYDKYKALIILTTSYVTFIYYSRSFSNTAEAFLFSILIYSIAKNIFNKMNLNVVSQELSQNEVKDRLINLEKSKPNFALIAFILILGFFNRPTFILFALIPMLYLVFYPVIISFTYFRIILNDLLKLLIYLSIYFFIFICIDTAYYNGVCFYKLDSITLNFSNFIITPLNFLIYNVKAANLKNHGIHPRYTHILVNMPLLFGPLVYIVIKNLRSFKILKTSQQFLLLSILVPLVTLSLFPHQEPRFLISLLTPIILLCVNTISSKLFILYLVFNVFLGLFYGFLHQGGVIPALSNLNYLIDRSNKTVIFWKTYMPPRFILMQGYKEDNYIKIYDLAGAPYSDVLGNVNEALDLKKDREQTKMENKDNRTILLVIPGTLSEFVKCNLTSEGFIIQEVQSYYFHLSTENLPAFLTENICGNEYVQFSFLQSVLNFINQISLVVFKLT